MAPMKQGSRGVMGIRGVQGGVWCGRGEIQYHFVLAIKELIQHVFTMTQICYSDTSFSCITIIALLKV